MAKLTEGTYFYLLHYLHFEHESSGYTAMKKPLYGDLTHVRLTYVRQFFYLEIFEILCVCYKSEIFI